MLSVRVVRRLGAFTLDVDFIAGREILVLFGPSGAGKTQTLDVISGLAMPDSGTIRLDDTTFFQRGDDGAVVLPPRDRRVGYVVQQYALFPHLTALQNVEYGLPPDAAPDTALQLMRKLRIDHAATRRPADLSGGEQQRVAIARALAIRPRVLLLDEPFAALDTVVRMQLHAAVREVQKELDLVVVYVTHNLDDAFSIGQRLAIIDEGKIQQIGSFEEVTSRPANDAVLRILGVRNPISGTVVESRSDAVVVDWSGVRLEAMPARHDPGDSVRGYIRGEDVKVIQEGLPRREALEKNNIRARLVAMQRGPWYNTLTFAMVENGRHIEISAVRESHAGRLQPGEEVTLAIKPKAVVVF